MYIQKSNIYIHLNMRKNAGHAPCNANDNDNEQRVSTNPDPRMQAHQQKKSERESVIYTDAAEDQIHKKE